MNVSSRIQHVSSPVQGGMALQMSLESAVGVLQERLSLHRAAGTPLLLLQSSTGGDPRWPEAPPWQEAIVERRESGEVLLAIGRAGLSHWSASWTPVHDDSGNGFDVEIACRLHETPGNLGSSWIAGPGESVIQTGRGVVVLESENACIELVAEPHPFVLETNNEATSFIRLIIPFAAKPPATIEYRYSIRLAPRRGD